MLFENPLFEKAMMHGPVLALVTYLLGESCRFDSMTGIVKTPSDEHLALHADLIGTPAPFPPYEEVVNATWMLTDYNAENGATCFVDGSHLRRRAPSPEEAVDLELFKPIEAPAGSVVIWGGRTWHGAVPRSAPGVRVSLLSYYTRWYIRTFSDQREKPQPTAEMIDRNSPRFRRLMGLDPMPFDGAEYPDGYNIARTAESRFA
jgi:ectoine hydroxylase-related dioxygenase (phytanoyl-CoA dioxygenase family)